MERITEKQLDLLVKHLNERTNSPIEPWSTNAEGKLKANIGNYVLCYANCGVSLERMQNESGGVETIFGTTNKKELFKLIKAFLLGMGK